jgi:hypothetical protein
MELGVCGTVGKGGRGKDFLNSEVTLCKRGLQTLDEDGLTVHEAMGGRGCDVNIL